MNAIVIDTETTGLHEPELIQFAFVEVDIHGGPISTGGGFQRSYKPSKPIQYGAMATHNIMDEDLTEQPPSSSFVFPEGFEYIIGHGVDFDWKVVGIPDVKRIDTLAMSRHLWPDTDSHKLVAMMYLLHRDRARAWAKDAHNAIDDVWMCARLLQSIIAKVGPFDSFEAMWKVSEGMRLPLRIDFGKHGPKDGKPGMLIHELPRDYKAWILREDAKSAGTGDAFDPYLIEAIRRTM